MEMKRCTKCKKVKDEEKFYFRDKKKGTLKSQDKEFTKKSAYERHWSKKGKWIYIFF